MQFNLVPHPSTEPNPPFKLWVNVDHAGALGPVATTNIWFGIGAPAARFVVPDPEEPGRADELWRSTCFEAFLKKQGAATYREWNFAPSGKWAAYDFTGYRENMKPADIDAPPYVRTEDNLTWWALGATIAVPADAEWELGLSAVLEEQSGAKTYWALAHPAQKPDFHAAGCFAARLA